MLAGDELTDGERWTLQVLAELREARFRPGAWGLFFKASFDRAAEQKRVHRLAHRQLQALTVVGLLAWGSTGILTSTTLAITGVAWLIALMTMTDWHLGMLETPNGRPLGRLGLANVVTIGRGAAVPILFVLGRDELVVALVVLGALDILDGVLARRRNECTRLGAWLDGSLDTIIVVAFVLAATQIGAIPGWLVVLVLGRVAAPWAVVGFLYFLTPTPPQSGDAVRASGWRARTPGVAAAIGLTLALVGQSIGTPIVAAAVAASFIPFSVAMVRSRAAVATSPP